jgi:GntR family transcriptional regulator/MocR family aminotransferase
MQLAVAEFLREGHYLRHLRRMKRLYAARRDALRTCLGGMCGVEAMAGLALVLRLPPGSDDVAVMRRALEHGLAPAALSRWYVSALSCYGPCLLKTIPPGSCRRMTPRSVADLPSFCPALVARDFDFVGRGG